MAMMLELALLLVFVLGVPGPVSYDASAPPSPVVQPSPVFDYQHVSRAIRYLEDPSPERLEALAETEASFHLKRHSDHVGTYPPSATRFDITKDLLGNTDALERTDDVKELMRGKMWSGRGNTHMCLEEVVQYGPQGARVEGKLFFTWGYDIGVAVWRNASINLTHPKFLENPSEIWYYCIHELHHTLVMQKHPLPRLADVEDTRELFELVRYLTFLEGTAVYAAYDARSRNGDLDADPDYIALDDPATMAKYEQAYFRLYRQIEELELRSLTDDDWAILEEFSSGDRLWYRVGARMAATIDREMGREALQEIIREGPAAFFEAYLEAASRTQE
jgi:hypothetical protein